MHKAGTVERGGPSASALRSSFTISAIALVSPATSIATRTISCCVQVTLYVTAGSATTKEGEREEWAAKGEGGGGQEQTAYLSYFT